jgi:ketosteroid isomerase-like protein
MSARPRSLVSGLFLEQPCGIDFLPATEPHPIMSEHDAVAEANRAFYRAFGSLDLENMERVWLRDPKIVCIHPGWRKLTGWGPIMSSWERIFDSVFEMNFELGDIEIIINGGLAVVVSEENLTQRGYDGVTRSQVLATNVYERVGNHWWLVLHHGSPVIRPPDDEPPLQ